MLKENFNPFRYPLVLLGRNPKKKCCLLDCKEYISISYTNMLLVFCVPKKSKPVVA